MISDSVIAAYGKQAETRLEYIIPKLLIYNSNLELVRICESMKRIINEKDLSKQIRSFTFLHEAIKTFLEEKIKHYDENTVNRVVKYFDNLYENFDWPRLFLEYFMIFLEITTKLIAD